MLRRLLSIPIQQLTLEDALNQALKCILDISFVAIQTRGVIFLMKEDGSGLNMIAQSGLHPEQLTICKFVPNGTCMCGRVAVSGKSQFASHVGEQHDIRYKGMKDHGHYCIPIRSEEKTLGAIALSVPAGHPDNKDELEMLQTIGNTLGLIVERKKAQLELLKLFTAVQHSSAIIVVTDADGIIEYINEKFTDITGYSEQEALSRKTNILRSEETKIDQYQDLWSTLNAGNDWNGTFLNRKKDGTHFWQKSSISPIKNSKGQITNFVSVGEDITEQKIVLEERDNAMHLIGDSIQYASRIQRSILPMKEVFNKAVSDYFVLWEPRDVVGGDIYWHRAWGSGSLIILGDCTGHGVPGAFMTLISNGALDEAYLETPPGDPATLLQRMHQLIQQSLGQGKDQNGKSDDGIELGACFLKGNGRTLVFAGARFDLFILQNGEVEIIKGTKAGLGYRETPYDVQFTNHEVELSPDQTFYMTSDGLIDQVGGEKRRGFGKRRFTSLISSLADVPLSEQGPLVLQALVEYQGDENRRDDVSVIGFNPKQTAVRINRPKTSELSPLPLVDCRLIDEDHRKLYTFIDKLKQSIDSGKGKTSALEIIGELASYTQWHFRHEERLMQEYGYPNQAEHETTHNQLIDQVSEVIRGIQEDEKDISIDLMQILQEWLKNHILDSDKQLADFLNSLGGLHDVNEEQLDEPADQASSGQNFFVLDDSLLVGYNVIDGDHQKLVDIMNKLNNALVNERGREEITETLNHLTDYTAWHFRHEVRLMQSNEYPDLDKHKREHELLISQLQEIQESFKDDQETPFKLNALLKSWLIDHIKKVDRELAAFMVSR
ncbi:MAG: bacteriohemerythrin [Deltaproteobacteria bacterium]|nr:bacteriohemerythrin [Deltaproteobacteria bacterium]